MERKKIVQTVRANGISAYNCYNTFMRHLNDTREKIKKLYPEVEDKDIDINIVIGDYEGCVELEFEFSRLETVEEQNQRLSNEEKRREYEKEQMMNEIQSFFKLYPDLKEELLNG